jgi:hypothetical protein
MAARYDVCAHGVVVAGIGQRRINGIAAVGVVAAHGASAVDGGLAWNSAGHSHSCGVVRAGHDLHSARAAVDGGIQLVEDVVAVRPGGEGRRAGEVGVCGVCVAGAGAVGGAWACSAGGCEVLMLSGERLVLFAGKRHFGVVSLFYLFYCLLVLIVVNNV